MEKEKREYNRSETFEVIAFVNALDNNCLQRTVENFIYGRKLKGESVLGWDMTAAKNLTEMLTISLNRLLETDGLIQFLQNLPNTASEVWLITEWQNNNWKLNDKQMEQLFQMVKDSGYFDIMVLVIDIFKWASLWPIIKWIDRLACVMGEETDLIYSFEQVEWKEAQPPAPPIMQVPPQSPIPPPPFKQQPIRYVPKMGETSVLSINAAAYKRAQLIRSNTQERVIIEKSEFYLGKGMGSDFIVKNNPTVSRRHAKILSQNGNYYIMDAGSTNHTYINGRQLAIGEQECLKDGDIIRLSNEDFVFEL